MDDGTIKKSPKKLYAWNENSLLYCLSGSGTPIKTNLVL